MKLYFVKAEGGGMTCQHPSPTVLQLISTGGFYGAERVLLELSVYLKARGWAPIVVALEGKGASHLVERAQELGLEARCFSTSRISPVRLVQQLRRLMNELGDGIVHSHGYKPDIFLSLFGRRRKWTLVSTCHTWYSDTARMRVWEMLDKQLLRVFDSVIAVSGDVERSLLMSGISGSRVNRIDNGIGQPHIPLGARLSVRESLGLTPSDRLVLQIGRLARSKRNDLLLDAIGCLSSRVPRLHVAIAGEGDEREHLAAQAVRLGMASTTHFLGYRSDIGSLLAAADLFVISSDQEGLPIALLEAMAVNCPVVATAVGAIPEVIKDGISGWLVPPNQMTPLADAIQDVFANTEATTRRIAVANKTFANKHSNVAMGEAYISAYKAALLRSTSRRGRYPSR